VAGMKRATGNGGGQGGAAVDNEIPFVLLAGGYPVETPRPAMAARSSPTRLRSMPDVTITAQCSRIIAA
ncbi:hypothetical protein, partial [Paracoccus thiocyanatus]|uniref:hypothetical protein n=1 Tax=Paracoccus thiocyanatus TaxID=34006 RepID=UPI001C6EFE62